MTPLARLLLRLPRVGEATATKMAQAITAQPGDYRRALAHAVEHEAGALRCGTCGDTYLETCRCCDPSLPPSPILVVTTARARVAACRAWEGQCHVLGGLLDQGDLQGVQALLERCRSPDVLEVILALDGGQEARATEIKIAEILRPVGIDVSVLGQGVVLAHLIDDVLNWICIAPSDLDPVLSPQPRECRRDAQISALLGHLLRRGFSPEHGVTDPHAALGWWPSLDRVMIISERGQQQDHENTAIVVHGLDGLERDLDTSAECRGRDRAFDEIGNAHGFT